MALSRGSRWFVGWLTLAVAAVAAGVWWLDVNLFDDGVTPGEPVEYTVERGAAVGMVADDLAELGVVNSSFRFRTAAEEAELPADLQPGVFELETGMSNEEAIEVLAGGPVAPPTITWTVPEGLTVEQTLERLTADFPAYTTEDFREVLDERIEAGEAALGDEDEGEEPDPGALQTALQLPEWFPEPAEAGPDEEPFEGVLWPQTYEIDDDADPQRILQRMIDQLDQEFQALPSEVLEEADAAERYRLMVIASLVERETRVDDEREVVAGVIRNRLAEEMQLQIDATVVYALGGGPTDQVTFDDLEIDSPYNTYRIDGLPPTPISGFGSASLAAAADPADVDFRFYVLSAECDGSHEFAETGEEHEANVEAFREADRCIAEDLGEGTITEVED